MLSLCALTCSSLAFADDKIPEVEIQAQREKLHVMQAQIVKLEDQFFAEYNKLNTDHQYDIFCNSEAPTGSILEQRVCRPVFVDRATADEARGLLDGHPAPPASLVVMEKTPDYEKNVQDAVRKHPELAKLVLERKALEKRYQTVRAAKLKGKMFVWD